MTDKYFDFDFDYGTYSGGTDGIQPLSNEEILDVLKNIEGGEIEPHDKNLYDAEIKRHHDTDGESDGNEDLTNEEKDLITESNSNDSESNSNDSESNSNDSESLIIEPESMTTISSTKVGGSNVLYILISLIPSIFPKSYA